MREHNTIFRSSFIENEIKEKFKITNEELAQKKEIITPWIEKIKSGRIYDQNEEQMQSDFINLIFNKLLDYDKDTSNPNVWNIEIEMKTDVDGKKPDGTFGYFYPDAEKNLVTAVLELKDAHHKDLDKRQNRQGDKRTPVEQGFDYAPKYKKGKANWVIISNFNEIRLYSSNKMAEHEKFYVENLLDDNELLRFLFLFSKSHILDSSLTKLIDANVKEEEEIEDKFYKTYKHIRFEIIEEIIENNIHKDKNLVIEKTQKLLDRFLFIAFCEDKHFIKPNIFSKMIDQSSEIMSKNDIFKSLCNDINLGNPQKGINKFNGGLFAHDDELYQLVIPDSVFERLKTIADYDFNTDVDENILGHIFEQSLNDLEELKAEYSGEQFDKTKTKRKKDGVFYTPKHITRKIVETSIQCFLEDKKVKLGYYALPELEAKDYDIKQTGMNKEQLTKNAEAHLTYLRKLRKELMSVKIVDPACGSGAFLITAYDVLVEEMNKINRQIQDLEKNQQSFFDSLDSDDELYSTSYNTEILKNCLYGVDLNKESVEITRLSLWLRTLSKDKPLTNLDNNIKVGNSLIDAPEVAGELAFNWQEQFPHVFEQGGFDIVIGNPPYGVNFNEDTKKYLSKFDNLVPDYEIYIYFISLYKKILSSNGYLSYIFPNTFLSTLFGKNYRYQLLKDTYIIEISDLSNDATFQDAKVRTIILLLKNTNIKGNVNFIKFNNQEFNIFESYDYEELISNCENIYSLFTINKKEKDIINKIINNNKLIDFFDVSQGLIPYDKYRGHDEYTIKNRIYHSCTKKDETYKKELKGEDIKSYSLNWNGNLWISYGNWLAAPRDPKFFINQRILVREITSKRLNACFTEEEYYNTPSLINIINCNNNMSLKYLLTILNSSLIGWYHNKTSPKANKGLFPKILINDIKKLPIKEINSTKQQSFIELADNMLTLHKEYNSLSNKFQRTLIRRFELEKLSNKLKNWYNLDYKEFTKELKKAKIKLSLSDEADWEDYFTTEKEKINTLQQEINKTDEEIDNLVYKLYDLTDEEIEIIKNS